MKTSKDDLKAKRILIVNVNWVGDVLFSTPFIRAIREHFPESYIACMVVPHCREILEGNKHLNEIIVYDEKGKHASIAGKLKYIMEIRKKRFDTAFLLHRSLTRTLIAFFAGIKTRVGYYTKKRALFLTNPVDISDRMVHRVEYFLNIARAVGIEAKSRDCEFYVPEEDISYVNKFLEDHGVKKSDTVVVIHPSANWPPKRWSEEKFAELCDMMIKDLGLKVVISGTEKELKIALKIQEEMQEKALLSSGKTSLKQLGALLKRADIVISGDSGPMHIAVAVKTRVIALFGPTSPEITGPYGSGRYKILRKDIGCEIPCYDMACEKNRCMEAISVDDVLLAVREML